MIKVDLELKEVIKRALDQECWVIAEKNCQLHLTWVGLGTDPGCRIDSFTDCWQCHKNDELAAEINLRIAEYLAQNERGL